MHRKPDWIEKVDTLEPRMRQPHYGNNQNLKDFLHNYRYHSVIFLLTFESKRL